jgi:hypothetical protein
LQSARVSQQVQCELNASDAWSKVGSRVWKGLDDREVMHKREHRVQTTEQVA